MRLWYRIPRPSLSLVTLSLSQVWHSHGPQRGGSRPLHMHRCVTQTSRFLEHRLVRSPCQIHRCDIAMVLREGGSRPWHMHRCVTQTQGMLLCAGFLELRLVWSPCQTHRCDIAMVLRGCGSRPWHMHRCVIQTQEMLLWCRIPRISLSLVTLSDSQVWHSHGPQRGWVTIKTHAQMCDTDLRRCYCGAGFLECHLVSSPCHSHRCDIAMVLRWGGSQPWYMYRCVTQTSGDAIVVQDS